MYLLDVADLLVLLSQIRLDMARFAKALAVWSVLSLQESLSMETTRDWGSRSSRLKRIHQDSSPIRIQPNSWPVLYGDNCQRIIDFFSSERMRMMISRMNLM